MTLFLSGARRMLRSRALWVGAALVALLSLYTALTLLAQAKGSLLPQLALTVVGSEPQALASAAGLTGLLGAFGLSGSLLPLVASLVTALFAAKTTQAGFDACLLSSGVPRASLVCEQLSAAFAASCTLCAAGAAPLGVFCILDPSTAFVPAAFAEGLCWGALCLSYIALYAFAAGLAVLLARRRLAGLLCAAFVSSGALEWLLGALSRGVPGLGAAASFLPHSLLEALSRGAAALFAPYGGSLPLWAWASLVVAVALPAAGALALFCYRKRSVL